MKFERSTPEVYFSRDPFTLVDRGAIAELKALASQNPSRRVRLCAHPNAEDLLHQMLIVQLKGAYIRPHKQLGKSKSFHMIEGDVAVVFFDDSGEVARTAELSASRENGAVFFRFPASVYHSLVPRSDSLVFFEVTTGPFRQGDTIFAPWAPGYDLHEAASAYWDDLVGKIIGGDPR